MEQLTIWDALSDGNELVKIDGALNVHAVPKIAPYDVTLTTGDLRLIVAMVEDYIRGLDIVKANDIQWQVYYRKKFKAISEKIQNQIEYDYEKALKKCLKKQQKESDIGEDAMILMIKKAQREAKESEE